MVQASAEKKIIYAIIIHCRRLAMLIFGLGHVLALANTHVLGNSTQPNPTQPNPTHGWTQPTSISALFPRDASCCFTL